MQDNLITTLWVMLQSLGVTFIRMTIIYSLIKVLVRYFPEDQ